MTQNIVVHQNRVELIIVNFYLFWIRINEVFIKRSD